MKPNVRSAGARLFYYFFPPREGASVETGSGNLSPRTVVAEIRFCAAIARERKIIIDGN